MREQDFLKHYAQNAQHLMWFFERWRISHFRSSDCQRHHLGLEAQVLMRSRKSGCAVSRHQQQSHSRKNSSLYGQLRISRTLESARVFFLFRADVRNGLRRSTKVSGRGTRDEENRIDRRAQAKRRYRSRHGSFNMVPRTIRPRRCCGYPESE